MVPNSEWSCFWIPLILPTYFSKELQLHLGKRLNEGFVPCLKYEEFRKCLLVFKGQLLLLDRHLTVSFEIAR